MLSYLLLAMATSLLQLQSSFGTELGVTELSVLVQNMQFLTLVGGTTEEMIARATKYGDLLVGLGNDVPDVIGFTETFVAEPTDTLVAKLNTTHPHQLRSFPKVLPDGKFLDSGLTLLSKYPIKAHDFRMFPEANGLDALAAKGILVALLRLPKSLAVVSVTHLNAGGTDAVFTSQLGTSRDLMKDFVWRNVPCADQGYTAVVSMGDYNIEYGSATYEEMLRTLAYSRTVDLHVLLNWWDGVKMVTDGGLTYPAENPTRRIDYIFQLDVMEESGCDFSSADVTQYAINDLVVEDSLSDHLGVGATISIAEKAETINSARDSALPSALMLLSASVVFVGCLL